MLVSSAAATHREEEHVVRAARQLGTAVAQVPRHVMRRFLAERHDAFLAALSAHVYRLALEVHVAEVEPDRLGAP